MTEKIKGKADSLETKKVKEEGGKENMEEKRIFFFRSNKGRK